MIVPMEKLVIQINQVKNIWWVCRWAEAGIKSPIDTLSICLDQQQIETQTNRKNNDISGNALHYYHGKSLSFAETPFTSWFTSLKK